MARLTGLSYDHDHDCGSWYDTDDDMEIMIMTMVMIMMIMVMMMAMMAVDLNNKMMKIQAAWVETQPLIALILAGRLILSL